MALDRLQLVYPAFELGEVIDPEETNINNSDIVYKVNQLVDNINSIIKVPKGSTDENGDPVDDGTGTGDEGDNADGGYLQINVTGNMVEIVPVSPFASTDVQGFLNELMTRLQSTTKGSSGAGLIGTAPIDGLLSLNVEDQLTELKKLVDSIEADSGVGAELTDHKVSSDHDTRYYTKTEVDTNHYTKAEIDANHYTKTETTSYVGGEIALLREELGVSSPVDGGTGDGTGNGTGDTGGSTTVLGAMQDDITALDNRLLTVETDLTANDDFTLLLDGQLNGEDGITSQLSTLEGTVAVNVEMLNSLDTDLTALDTRVADLETNVGLFDGRLVITETTLASFEEEVTGLSGRVSTNEASINGLGVRISGNEGDISSLSREISSLSDDINDVSGNVSDLDTRVSTLEATQDTGTGGTGGVLTRIETRSEDPISPVVGQIWMIV